MNDKFFTGILIQKNKKNFLQTPENSLCFEKELIWEGYIRHWLGKRLHARRLPQKDYETKRPIILMWPAAPFARGPYVDLYFNERLVHYPISILGHIAVNVNGEVFNFSHLLNEDEVISVEEYFYRPALGEFAPHPGTGGFDIKDRQMPYYDKFGRIFMRTVHVLRIQGLHTARLSKIFHDELKTILNTPVHPHRPWKYRDFNMFTRSCTTIIRDGLRACGFPEIRGIAPRDLFVNASYHLYKLAKNKRLKISRFSMKQLKVPEAPYSAMAPLLNPFNIFRNRRLPNNEIGE
jgi:hypothetical protein